MEFLNSVGSDRGGFGGVVRSQFDVSVTILHFDGDCSFLIGVVSSNLLVLFKMSDFVQQAAPPLSHHEVDEDILVLVL